MDLLWRTLVSPETRLSPTTEEEAWAAVAWEACIDRFGALPDPEQLCLARIRDPSVTQEDHLWGDLDAEELIYLIQEWLYLWAKEARRGEYADALRRIAARYPENIGDADGAYLTGLLESEGVPVSTRLVTLVANLVPCRRLEYPRHRHWLLALFMSDAIPEEIHPLIIAARLRRWLEDHDPA